MITQEQSTQTDRSAHASLRFCGLKLSDVLKLISSLLLPLAFGVFTVVISFEHQRSAKQQRTEDQIAAEQLREQERNLNEERYKNDVFDVYIRDLATLLKDGNGSLTSNKVIANVAQLKSLNIFRQLDPSRNNRIMRFLYETKALTENDDSPALDLSTTKFLNTDFRDLAINKKILNNLSLTGIFLSNATFIGIEMKDINFASTQFDTVDCSLGSLSYINFSSTHWKNANFSSTQLDTVKFSSAELHNINFSLSRLKNVDFGSANLTGIDFSFNQLDTVNFSSAELNNINFSSSHLKNNDFRFATLRNIDFSSTQLDTVDFSFALLLNVSLSYSSLVNAKFSSATAHYVKFSFANLSYADFSRANTSYMDFRQTNCIAARFTYADLSYSSFGKSNAKHAWFVEADLTNVNFSRANLYKAHFVRTNISDDQLQSALSIQGALLSNQTFARDMNLISNGQADCNIFLGNGWTLQTGNITTMASDKDTSDCRFVLQSHNIGAAMLQKIDLSKKWDSKSWSYSQAVLSARMSPSVHIELRGINTYDSVSARETLSSKEDKINLILLNDMRKLEVYIEFNISSNESATSYWCDDIRLYIVYDAYGEFQRSKFVTGY